MFRRVLSILILFAPAPAQAWPAQPVPIAAPGTAEIESALREVLGGFMSFRFFQCDSPGGIARLQTASARFRALHPPLLAAIAAERAALIEAEMSVDPAFVHLPGCVAAPELDRRVTAIEEALDRLGALLGRPPEATGEARPLAAGAALRAVALFERFCLATGADRARFDAAVGAAGLRKTSAPLTFSGLELNRRWDAGEGAELSFLDSPGRRECWIAASGADDFDEAAVAASVAALGGRPLRRSEQGSGHPGHASWAGATRDGSSLYVNILPPSDGRRGLSIGTVPIAVER